MDEREGANGERWQMVAAIHAGLHATDGKPMRWLGCDERRCSSENIRHVVVKMVLSTSIHRLRWKWKE